MKEFVELERLRDKVRRPSLDRVYGVFDGAETGDHDGDDARIPVPGRFDHSGPVDTWQTKVGNDDVEGELLEQLQRAFAAVGLNDLEAPFSQPLGHQPTERGLVIDDRAGEGPHPGIARCQYLDTGKPNDRVRSCRYSDRSITAGQVARSDQLTTAVTRRPVRAYGPPDPLDHEGVRSRRSQPTDNL